MRLDAERKAATSGAGAASEGGQHGARSLPLPPQVLERVQRREPEALALFFDHYFGRVFGVVYRLIGEHHQAEDVTQEVFLKVYRAADRLDPALDPAPWLIAIATNACRDLWRSGRHRLARQTGSLDDDSARRVPSPVRSPEGELIARERERLVQEAIAGLPEALRVAVVLHDYEGLPHDEIAAILGVSGAAVRKRYSRALRELGSRLRSMVGP